MRVKKKKSKRVSNPRKLSPAELKKLKRLHQKYQKEVEPIRDVIEGTFKSVSGDLATRITTKS